MSPSVTSRPPRYRPALNGLTSNRAWVGCGCQSPVTTSACRRLTSPGFGVERGALALPIVLGRRRDAIAIVTATDHEPLFECIQRLAYLCQPGVGVDGWMQGSGDVLRRAVDAAHVLQQADGLGNGLGERVRDLAADIGDLGADLAANVAGDEVVDLVGPRKGADGGVGQGHIGVNQQLLGELDDGAVGAADVLAGTALGAQAGDDLDDQIDLVREQRVEIDEGLGGQLQEPDIGRHAGVVGQPPAVLGEPLAQQLLGRGMLGQDTLAGDLGDVRRLQVHLQREAVHQPRQLDPAVVEATDQLSQLLLGGDDHPELAAADPTEASAPRPGGRASSARRAQRTAPPRRSRRRGSCPACAAP